MTKQFVIILIISIGCPIRDLYVLVNFTENQHLLDLFKRKNITIWL